MLLDREFQPLLAHLDLTAVDASDDPTYFVDSRLVIRGVNRAYVDFALSNGFPDVRRRGGPGCDLQKCILPPAREFYVVRFFELLMSGEPWHHEYECSSPDEFREYRQAVYPLPAGRGLVISNHLIVRCPYPDAGQLLNSDHLSPEGLISQCSHCRKVRNWSRPGGWDWVPLLVSRPDPRVSHTFCDLCRDHYYPESP